MRRTCGCKFLNIDLRAALLLYRRNRSSFANYQIPHIGRDAKFSNDAVILSGITAGWESRMKWRFVCRLGDVTSVVLFGSS
mmetsp:Transcript_22871/g.47981  ORF Transcript_22871/g.47981 Transcript_22871/m.47981 type:complete len:81 (+) Transcript_22871:561-803(+)